MSRFDQEEALPWPYVIRRSSRAKRFILKLCPKEGVVVVYPRWASRRQALQFMQEHRSWIASKASAYPILSSLSESLTVPIELVLPALDRWYECCYNQSAGQRYRIDCSGNDFQLVFDGIDNDLVNYLKSLRTWLKEQARLYLEPRFTALAQTMNLPFTKVSWRIQKTLWGSCSQNKAISLNAKLLFMAPSLARYVMVHELCHTRYWAHNRDFWSLVEQWDRDYRLHDRQLSQGIWERPAWVDLL